MAFDRSVQFQVKQAGMIMETGILAFTTSGVTVEVPTKLKKILSGMGVTIDTSGSGVPQPVGLKDTTITSGAVTMERPASGTSGASFCYVLFGH